MSERNSARRQATSNSLSLRRQDAGWGWAVYCGCGRLTEIIEEDPTTRGLPLEQRPKTTFVYDDETEYLKFVRDPLNREREYFHDVLGRTIQVVTPQPDATTGRTSYTTVYGALGHVLSETAAAGGSPEQTTTSYHIDNRGRIDKVTLPHDGVTNPIIQTVFNAAGEPIKETDPLNRITRNRFDALGRLARTYNPVTGMTRLSYDKNSNLTSQIDVLGRETLMQYDARDRQTQVTDPRGGVTKFTYDDVSNLRSIEDAQQNLTQFFYNNWDLVKEEKNELLASRFYAYGSLTGELHTGQNYLLNRSDPFVSCVTPLSRVQTAATLW